MGKDKKSSHEKIEAKKARQNAKQNKVATKRLKKELQESGDVDIGCY
jgi:hypothetical protein